MHGEDKLIGPIGTLSENQVRVAVAVQGPDTLIEVGHRRSSPQSREDIRTMLHGLVNTVCDSLEDQT